MISPDKFLDHFSSHLKQVIARSISLAASADMTEVTPAQMLLALHEEDGSVGAEILHRLGITSTYIHTIIGEGIDAKKSSRVVPILGKSAKAALEKAMLVAYEHEHRHVGTEHLLYGLVTTPGSENTLDALCALVGTSKQTIEKELETIFTSITKFNQNANEAAPCEHDEEPTTQTAKPHKKRKQTILDAFAVDLTHQDAQTTIDPVIGREKELERLIHVLARRNKNNPVLVGEPGVGKTAIVEGLAKRIFEGSVPDILKRKKILSLDLTAMVAGTMYRGEFESRLKQVMTEVAKNPDYIVFIDELHTIIGAGSNQGSMDAANMLKPALARGQLRCIGATTEDEYKKHITSDPALERRFQAITVDEPTPEETKTILRGIKDYYEAFHHVVITDEAIDAAVELSHKFIHDNFLPDKAIDLIDEAAAAERTKRKSTPMEKRLAKLEQDLEDILEQKESAIHSEAYESAIDLKKAQSTLEATITEAKAKLDARKKTKRGTVDVANIVRVVSDKTHIPTSLLTSSEWERIDSAIAEVKERIIGQTASIDVLHTSLKQAHLGFRQKGKPFASFLFVGPSGVGKTATAKALAHALYRDEQALIRVDMSEYAEGHGVSKLLGSPAGYVGFKDRNPFTDALRKRPHAVVLFDEFDKAHGDVQKLLLQILDEGSVTDSAGKKVSFAESIVILTTNIGAERFSSPSFGFYESQDAVRTHQEISSHIKNELKQTLGQALMSRITTTCLFTPLTEAHLGAVAEKHIETLSQTLGKTRNIRVSASKSALLALGEKAMKAKHGARVVEHIVHQTLQDLLITELLEREENKEERLYTLSLDKKTFILT